MRSGRLKHFVTFQTRSLEQGRAGDQSGSWTDSFQDYVAITPLSGRDLIAAQSRNAAVTHKIEMRYRDGVSIKMRILYGSRKFDIRTPPRNVEERGREMVFEAEEGLNNG